jgi:hypothetical protein
MRAISLWQPWASLIAFGEKQYETRHWTTPYRGKLAIHAAKRWTAQEKAVLTWYIQQYPDLIDKFGRQPILLGAIVCVVNLTDVQPTEITFPRLTKRELSFGNYGHGRFTWQLELVEIFENPIPAKGAQGFFEWTRPQTTGM